MNTPKLKVFQARIKLWRYKSSVRMRVLEQSPMLQPYQLFKTNVARTIRSCSYPELTDDTIYLRGRDKHLDNSIAVLQCSTEEEASFQLRELRRAFRTIRTYDT